MPRINLSQDEIPLETPLRVEHEGHAIVVIRTAGGVSAFEDRCPHADWPLSEGEIRDGVLQCAGHGWEFDAATGRCINAPAYCLTTVTVTVEGGQVWLEWE